MLAICLSAQGYVVVWKIKLTASVTGSGTVSKRTLSGYMILNTDDYTLTQVQAETARRTFSVITQSDLDISEVKGLQGKWYMTVTKATSYIDDNLNVALDFVYAKGAESYLDIGDPMYNWLFPKTLQLTGKQMYSDDSGQPALNEYTGTLVFDKGTFDANFFGHSIGDVITGMRQSYLNQGYSEL